MMGLKASFVGPDFIVSVGDNFYPSEYNIALRPGPANGTMNESCRHTHLILRNLLRKRGCRRSVKSIR